MRVIDWISGIVGLAFVLVFLTHMSPAFLLVSGINLIALWAFSLGDEPLKEKQLTKSKRLLVVTTAVSASALGFIATLWIDARIVAGLYAISVGGYVVYKVASRLAFRGQV
jgi:hypothetical protein